jgi:hypothetical protein
MASLNFDATQVAPAESRDYTVLPAGLYTVEITDADVKPLKSGNGTGLNLEFTIIDPAPFAKRKVWQSLNIKHTSAEAEKIGKSQLSALCHAVGILQLTDSDQLFQRIVRIRTKVRKQEGYDPKAEVTGYEPAGAALPAANSPATAPAAAGAAAPPWKKRAA